MHLSKESNREATQYIQPSLENPMKGIENDILMKHLTEQEVNELEKTRVKNTVLE